MSAHNSQGTILIFLSRIRRGVLAQFGGRLILGGGLRVGFCGN